MSASLNISGQIDPATVAIFEAVGGVARELDMPYVVVGATARDLVLHYGYGVPLQRATRDVDFAIEVPDWAAFDVIKSKLEAQGFKADRAQHRLYSPANVTVDIVPFGQVENDNAVIAWPPNGTTVMNVLGFQEACDHANWVRIQDDPVLDVPVVTPAGMMLLKLIAWADRAADLRRKDALDITYLLSTYERIPSVTDTLYDDRTEIMNQYDWDITLSSAHLLGDHSGSIARDNTRSQIASLAAGRIGGRARETLIEEMCTRRSDSQYEQNERLLTAFLAGFNGSKS